MRRLLIAVISLSAACGGARAKAKPQLHAELSFSVACRALPTSTAITIAGERRYDELHELFDLEDSPALWAAAPEDEVAASYRKEVTRRVGDVSPRALVERERAVFAGGPLAREAANSDPVLDGRAATVFGEPTCIERQLFARQAARYPMLEHPTELGAFLLRGNGRAHVYFSSMDLVGQKIRKEVTERVADDVAHGFVLVAHVHSHPFCFDRHVGDRCWTTAETMANVSGGLAPSLADAGLWKHAAKEMGMREGWITNGFASSHTPAKSFVLFAAHGE